MPVGCARPRVDAVGGVDDVVCGCAGRGRPACVELAVAARDGDGRDAGNPLRERWGERPRALAVAVEGLDAHVVHAVISDGVVVLGDAGPRCIRTCSGRKPRWHPRRSRRDSGSRARRRGTMRELRSHRRRPSSRLHRHVVGGSVGDTGQCRAGSAEVGRGPLPALLMVGAGVDVVARRAADGGPGDVEGSVAPGDRDGAGVPGGELESDGSDPETSSGSGVGGRGHRVRRRRRVRRGRWRGRRVGADGHRVGPATPLGRCRCRRGTPTP